MIACLVAAPVLEHVRESAHAKETDIFKAGDLRWQGWLAAGVHLYFLDLEGCSVSKVNDDSGFEVCRFVRV
jgi:hypothetical protein